MKRRSVRSTGLAVALMVWAAVFSFIAAPALSAEKATYREGWFGTGLYAPWWLAKDAGYFAKRGLEVEVQEGKGGGVAVQLVGSKTVSFGDADGNTIMQAIHAGAKVKSVYGILRRNAVAVIAHGDARIRKPKDLEGKSLAIPPGSSQFQQFPIFLQMSGVDASKVKVIQMAPTGLVSAVLSKKADSLSSYPPTIVPVFEAAKVPVTVVNFGDYGVAVVGQSIVTHDDLIEQKPQVVRAFVEASAEAWSHARKNPADAAKAYVKYLPMHRVQVVQRQLTLYLDYLDSEAARGKPLGWQPKESWQLTEDIALKTGVVKSRKPLEAYYTNKFVPGAN